MSRHRAASWWLVPAFVVLHLCCLHAPAQELSLGDGGASPNGTARIALRMSSDDEVEGLVAAFDWDPAVGTGVALIPSDLIALGVTADRVEIRVEDAFAVLAVVVDDNDDLSPPPIPAGDGQLLATLEILCGPDAGSSPVGFRDGLYSVVPTSPPLTNAIVVDGLPITAVGIDLLGGLRTLTLSDGSVECRARPDAPALQVGEGFGSFGQVAEVPLLVASNGIDVEGVVLAFDWNGTNGTGESIEPALFIAGVAIDDIDLVQSRIENDFGVFGLVVDLDGDGAAAIPDAFNPYTVATLGIRCAAGDGSDASVTTPIELRDGTYAMVPGGPVLDNIVVAGGNSLGQSDGTTLVGGSFTCEPRQNGLVVESGGNVAPDDCGDIRILLDNRQDVEGFVVAVCHDEPTLELVSAIPDGLASAADFSEAEIDPFVGGTLGVVLDLVDPMSNPPVIAPGAEQHIATFRYCCTEPPEPGEPDRCFPLTLCDGALGSPRKDDILVISGLSIGASDRLALTSGEFCCAPVGPPQPQPKDCANGRDDDGDGLVDEDAADPECQVAFKCGDLSRDTDGNGVPEVEGVRGGEIKLPVYVVNPEDEGDNAVNDVPGRPRTLDHLQGLSMSICFDCALVCSGVFDSTDTILEAIDTEFISVDCDNDPVDVDGDGCEVILAILVDALPPFDGRTIPPSGDFDGDGVPDPQLLGSLCFQISEDAVCGEKLSVEFVDGKNGSGQIPIKNLVSSDNHSRGPALMPCEVCVKERERFFRGDCNFSLMTDGESVNIADAASVVSFLFLPGAWQFRAPCLDACDCNDDGRVDLADTICILQFLFAAGRLPPAPWPGIRADDISGLPELDGAGALIFTPPGVDPTVDKLDCASGRECTLTPH